MYILYAIMQTQLRKNIDAAHTYTNTAKEREGGVLHLDIVK